MYFKKPQIQDQKNFGMEHVITHKLQKVITPKFEMHFFNSLTNLKIILLTKPNAKFVEDKLLKIYQVYADFVRNNWRYMSGQPIKSRHFVKDIDSIFNN